MVMDSTLLIPQLDLDWDNLFTLPDEIEISRGGKQGMAFMDSTHIPQFWSELDLDWDNIFTDEIDMSRDSESIFHIIPPSPSPPHFYALASDNAAAKKRKRNQSIVFSEKMRRKRMRQFLSTLTSILPIPNTKVARYCLIEETIKYIEKLHHQVQELKKKREQLLGKKKRQELSSPSPSPSPSPSTVNANVEVEVYGDEVLIRITSLKMPRNLWKIYQVIEAQHLDIQSADTYTGDCIVLLSFRANCTSDGSFTQMMRQSLQTDLQKAYQDDKFAGGDGS